MLLVAYFAALTSAYDVNVDLASNLAQMPLDKLVHVKQLLFMKTENDPDPVENRALIENGNIVNSPDALKIKGDWLRNTWTKKQDDLKRGDWVEDWNRKGGKLQHVFASTITILAFLAFGGYLITMVVLALRNNQGLLAAFAPTATTTVTATGRRKRRAIDNTPFIDDAVESLHRLARGYSCYHAVNSSKKLFTGEEEEKYCV